MTNPIYTTNQNPKYEFAFNPINSDYEPVYELDTKESKNELYVQQEYEQSEPQPTYEQSENIQSFSHQQDIYEPQYDNDNDDDSSENYLNFTS